MTLSELCQRCGLCCDGTLFTHVALTSAERQRLSGRIEERVRKDLSVTLAQPCQALSGRCCQVYEDRPAGCRAFVCLLGSALGSKEVSFDEAAATVARVHEELSALHALLPKEDAPDERQTPLMRARRLGRADAGPVLSDEARTAWRALEATLRAHFLGRLGR